MRFVDDWLNRLNRRFGRYAIRNLMTYLVAGMAVVYLMDMLVYPATRFSLSSYLAFDRAAIMRGQVWRLITFVLLPSGSSPLFLLLTLYFYWLIGSTLERQWGAFRFNAYYLCGVVGAIAAGFITGSVSNYYLNLSLFLAFAMLYPDYEILVFFFLPVKMKYLALLDALGLLLMFVTGGAATRVALVFALLNVVLFFGGNLVDQIKAAYRRYKWKQNFK